MGIVGAGFAGLAAAVYALEAGFQVELFDAVGIGGGASGVASGLLHPFPGKQARRSRFADEGMASSLALLELSAKELGESVYQAGVVRHPLDAMQTSLFQERAEEYPDLEWDGTLKILSGVTVFPQKYLAGLWRYCQRKGAVLQIEKIDQIPDGFDAVILAAGQGMLKLTDLKLHRTKGQILECDLEVDPQTSVIGDGYLARAESGYHLGSTYEHQFEDDLPDLQLATELILPRAKRYVKGAIHVKGVKAGVRVAQPGNYFPISCEIQPGVYALTGFGSRGLLYHALLAKELVNRAYSSV